MLHKAKDAEEARWNPSHAPVLIVPKVLSPEESAGLVQSVVNETPFMARQPRPGESAAHPHPQGVTRYFSPVFIWR